MEGRYLVIGFTSSIQKIPLNLALLKGCQIVGVFWGSFVSESDAECTSFNDLFEMHAKKLIQPKVEKVFSLDETIDAIESLANREAKEKLQSK